MMMWEIENLLEKAIKKEKQIRPDRANFFEDYHKLKNQIISNYKIGIYDEQINNKFAKMQIEAEIIVTSWLKKLQKTIII